MKTTHKSLSPYESGMLKQDYVKKGLEIIFKYNPSSDAFVEWDKACAVCTRTYPTTFILDLALMGFEMHAEGKSLNEIKTSLRNYCTSDDYIDNAVDIICRCYKLDQEQAKKRGLA